MRKNIIRLLFGGTGTILLAALWLGGKPIMTADGKQSKALPADSKYAKEDETDVLVMAGNEKLCRHLTGQGTLCAEDVFSPATIAALSEPEPTIEPVPVIEPVTPEGLEPEVIQPEPEQEPNEPIVVAAAEPTPEPPPSEEPAKAELPVTSSIGAPGNTQISSITVTKEPEVIQPEPEPEPAVTVSDQMASIQGGCTIMGTSYTYLDQMVRYYNANEKYPAFYANSDAPTIEDFCRIYIEEAEAEGVRAEVAFCQAMKETGFLRFLGDVRIEQFNFAGIGTTGGGVQGHYFDSVRQGIRAQIQHLKAYASTANLKNGCVDPRFSYVRRGTIPYVEWLGIKESPTGGGWAAAENYGGSIVQDYIVKLFSN